ncbi:protein NETWORKED 2A-like [Herrania umbratica]|uniref:Protein NETWORKED 2A-like n=1 Tax=Herrania umbratica TaxID=108875 RepID=A0A6J1ABN0_9ROSI|nr:protein NETWORKED 2A-like [Herrania umbratica]
MLQRAASNAYSWWWASHIRTKQSKWLEQNLQDMEEKVSSMLTIIDDDGDSFAQRAEMYYRRRPELVNIVEESYRAYRALAERYDHLSKDLQSANRTIASVFPEQVPFAMDEEDEENVSQTSTSSPCADKPSIPKPSVPKAPFLKKDFRSQSVLLLRKGQLKRASSSAKAAAFPSSGLSKNEALDEIDNLQKEILELQTEREFVKSSYEHGYKKFCEIEHQITEKQKRVCNLQDEFGIGSVIDDNEARALMAARALKSCQETLAKLKEKHEQSTEEARVESRRIKKANQKFEALRNKFNSPQTNQQEKHKCVSPTTEFDNMVYDIESEEKERQDLEALRKEIEEQLEVSSNGSFTVSQLAEKIDDLVQRVVNLETAVFSENALVMRLRSETDELQFHVKSLEEDKEALIEEKKNRDGFFELALQIRELKNAVASRDGEIQSLRQKMSFPDQNKDGNFVELEGPRLSASQESTVTESIQAWPVVVGQGKVESEEKVVEATAHGRFEESPKTMGEILMQVKPVSQPRHVLTVEEKIRSDIDDLLEENLEFWLRFSTSFHQIQKYQTSVQDLKAELSTLRGKMKQEGSGKQHQSLKSEARPIYSHLREVKTELTLWLENNAVLKDEVQGRYSSLCNIQEEIARVTNASGHAGETELSGYQAAKFQGEVLNMKQENNKVADELKAGFDRVRQLKLEVEKVMANLERELGVSASTAQNPVSRTGKPRIPLRSFLFGIKLKNKRQLKGSSMFACGHPTLQKQLSFLSEPTEPSR